RSADMTMMSKLTRRHRAPVEAVSCAERRSPGITNSQRNDSSTRVRSLVQSSMWCTGFTAPTYSHPHASGTLRRRALCRAGVPRRGAVEGAVGRGHQMLQFAALVGDVEWISLQGCREAALRAECQSVSFDTGGRSFDPPQQPVDGLQLGPLGA